MSRLAYASAVLVSLVLCASPAFAGPLATDLAGLPGFTGSVGFSNSGLAATMDYAVFAPGAYTGNNPFKANEYVYAYQVFDTGTTALSSFSVGLLTGNGAHSANADSTYPLTGGVAPSPGVFIQSNSVLSIFSNPTIAAGTGYSQVVVFASPNAPTYASASVVSAGLSDQKQAPTPTPEPTTLGLLGLLGVGLLRRRSR